MYTALVATPFIGTGIAPDTRRPKFEDSFPGITYTDVVGIPAARLGGLVKNVYIIEVKVSDALAATLTNVGADANYVLLYQERTDDTDGHVISGNRQSTLTGPQLNAIKTWLQARGYVAGDLSGVSLPITREDAAAALVTLFRNAT